VRRMRGLVRHRQPKGAGTDRLTLPSGTSALLYPIMVDLTQIRDFLCTIFPIGVSIFGSRVLISVRRAESTFPPACVQAGFLI